MSLFLYGIEHEVAFMNSEWLFADFLSTIYTDFAAIIERLPIYAEDYPQLRLGSTGIRQKRWYIEGLDRHNDDGQLCGFLPKGIEIRTTPQPTIQAAIEELTTSFQHLRSVAENEGFVPVLTSYHPFRTEFQASPPFNAFEEELLLQNPEERGVLAVMLTYGPDLNISWQGLSPAQIVDLGSKLTFYSPYIIPFSFSSPFYRGTLWDGLSVRTFQRTGARPATKVFLANQADTSCGHPSFTRLARTPGEAGRIEFKACDSCGDFTLYAALLALLKGLTLDTTLPGRALTPDIALHHRSACWGWRDSQVASGTRLVLQAAEEALADDEDARLLAPLRLMLQKGVTAAHVMIQQFREGEAIMDILRAGYHIY